MHSGQAVYSAAERSPALFKVLHKGLGVVCVAPGGIPQDEYIVDLLGEVYPPWKWCEKQDAVRQVGAR